MQSTQNDGNTEIALEISEKFERTVVWSPAYIKVYLNEDSTLERTIRSEFQHRVHRDTTLVFIYHDFTS